MSLLRSSLILLTLALVACGPSADPAGATGAETATTTDTTDTAATAEAETTAGVPAIVARSIEYHGGDLYRASRTTLTQESRSGAFRVEAEVDGGTYRYVVERPMPDGTTERVTTTNNAVVRTVDGEPVAVPAENEQRLRDFVMARVYFPFLPYRLDDPTVHHQDLGLERWGERELHKIRVTFAEGSSTDAEDVYLYWFDPETARLEQFAYSFAVGEGGLRFRRAFNHRRVGGILFYDSENLGVNGHDWRVEQLTPAFVEAELETISTVRLSDIEVAPL